MQIQQHKLTTTKQLKTSWLFTVQ